jgi:hypothetical protein
MREVEDVLREAPLSAPPPRLRARVDDALARAEARGARWFRLPVPLWACAAAAIVCGALGALGHSAFTPPPPQVVYILPAEGELRRLLTGEADRRPEDELKAWRVTVTTPTKKRL